MPYGYIDGVIHISKRALVTLPAACCLLSAVCRLNIVPIPLYI